MEKYFENGFEQIIDVWKEKFFLKGKWDEANIFLNARLGEDEIFWVSKFVVVFVVEIVEKIWRQWHLLGKAQVKELKIFNAGCTREYWKPVLKTVTTLLRLCPSVVFLKFPGYL